MNKESRTTVGAGARGGAVGAAGGLAGVFYPPSRSGDAQLVAALKDGDPAAFEDLLKRFETKVYNLARGLMHNEADAMDAMQETFLSVFKNIKSFKGGSSLSTWIYRIAANAALMKLRKRKHDDRIVPIDELMPTFDDTGHRVASLPDWHPRADQILLNKELGSHLREAIAALDPDHRAVLILRDQEGLDNEEVAAALGLSVPAVKSRLHRARIFLREKIKRYVLEGRQ